MARQKKVQIPKERRTTPSGAVRTETPTESQPELVAGTLSVPATATGPASDSDGYGFVMWLWLVAFSLMILFELASAVFP